MTSRRPAFPRHEMPYTWCMIVPVLLSGFLAHLVWLHFIATPAQRFYFGDYAKAKVMSLITGQADSSNYDVPGPQGTPRTVAMNDRVFGQWLYATVYHRPFAAFFILPLFTCMMTGCLLFPLGFYFDNQHNIKAREGKRLRGPEMVTRWQFNRKVKGDGFALPISNKPNLIERVTGNTTVRIRKKDQSSHILAMGDVGFGKSTIIKARLDEMERNGETGVIYDPHMEFTPLYYRPDRGDVILNPFDSRCPSLDFSDEIDPNNPQMAEANAMAMSVSAYPGDQHHDKNWFFVFCSRQIFSYIQNRYRPTPREMAYMLDHADPLIDMVVQDTALRTMMADNADAQRGGVQAHLAFLAWSLRQIPDRASGRRHFVIREWCEKRARHIFITNTPATRDGLRPLQSLQIDWLILCLLSQGYRSDLPNVNIFLDELPTLERLPQLVALLTESRKTALSAFLGIQGAAQLRAIYGPEWAQVILSTPFTKYMGRTTDPDAQESLSKIIGDVELERARETLNPPHHRGAASERTIKRLVMGSEFGGLNPLTGYMKYGNLVLPFTLPIPKDRDAIAPAFIPNPSEGPIEKRPIPTLAEAKAEAARKTRERFLEDMRMRQDVAAQLESEKPPKPPKVPTAKIPKPELGKTEPVTPSLFT